MPDGREVHVRPGADPHEVTLHFDDGGTWHWKRDFGHRKLMYVTVDGDARYVPESSECAEKGERMTDNRTSGQLCKLLEERGLSCQTDYLHASWCVGSKLYDAVDNLDGTLTVDNLTPEQAIAATLRNGTLTAEQVSMYLKAMAYDLQTPNPFKTLDEKKAIIERYAHEIAEFGSGTCRITASATDGLCSDNPRIWFKLSCGHSFTLDGLGAPVACAVCGKAVER